jgi:Domain of unknown function (DUF4259)
MGTWGTGIFENDISADWVDEPSEATSIDKFRMSILNALVVELVVDTDTMECAIGTCAVVAYAGGAHRDDVPDGVRREGRNVWLSP